jgi:hypothetical protein
MTSPLITLDGQAARAILDGLASGLPSDWSQPGARDAVRPMLGQLRTRGCLILPGIVRSLALSPERGTNTTSKQTGTAGRLSSRTAPGPTIWSAAGRKPGGSAAAVPAPTGRWTWPARPLTPGTA